MNSQAKTLSIDKSTERPTETAARDLNLTMPPALFEAIAHRAADLVTQESSPDPYLDTKHAAEYLDCGKSRLHTLVSIRRIPHHRDGTRLLFRRSELDEWIRNGGGKRP